MDFSCPEVPIVGQNALAARGRLGSVVRRHADDPALIDSARRGLAAAKIEDYIERTVAAAPPLTDDQRDRLALLLRDSGGPGHAA